MKKTFFLLSILFIGVSLMAQNVVVQTTNNPSQSSKDDCVFRINGICSTEDIGGVDARYFVMWSVTDESDPKSYIHYKDIDGFITDHGPYFLLENYHNFPVNVLLLIGNGNSACDDKTFNVVLKPGAKKLVYTDSCNGVLYSKLKGIITRKF